ncbi:dihydrodipicolinate synthase family protein [uncultured Cohaesibacter sp.]|uniref:dihydrodipicolinate synthase family protein n=1 Tax=uncultured Cohaesibacter sp. TaxID=1002546 RepID=UPI00292E0FE9|nr:dihydrodipicolinate synthase family protein [uncultured Cohaesibacter sp.]
MLNGTDLKGVVGAAITPLHEAFDIHVPLLKHHCDQLLADGCAFTSVFGTTGEGASFSVRQKLEALNALKDLGLDMSRQIPGIMTASLDDAATMYAEVAKLKCRAALIIPPFFYREAGVEGVADYYEALVKRAGNPGLEIVLYNFPHFSGITFTVEQVQAVLARLGKLVIGIKDSTGDLNSGLPLIEVFPQLSVFTGSDAILRQMVDAGGAGMIGGMTNPFAKDCVQLYLGGVSEGFIKRATKRIEAVDGNGGLTVLKAIMAERYDDPAFARVVPPLKPLSSDKMSKIKMELSDAETLVA